jgi:predicted permease
MISTLWQEIKYAARSLRRTPGFTAAAIVTLALGIGGTTAIFSLMYAVMFRTLPVDAPDGLYFIAHGGNGRFSTASNYPWLERARQLDDVFTGVAAFNIRRFKVSSDDGLEQVTGQFVSGNYHGLIGVPLALGRGFTAEDDRAAGSSPLAVISDAFWARRFNRSPDVLGQTLVVGGHPLSIVGVTAPRFDGLEPGESVDVTLPLSIRVQDEPDFLSWHDTWTSMPLVARLKPGVTMERAQPVLEAAYRQYMSEPENQEFSRTPRGDLRTSRLLPALRGSDDLRRGYATPLSVLMGMVGVVLLIACVNVANLLLVRGAKRAREVAIRMSVGASRWQIARQLLTESLMLAVSGGAIGVLLAGWGTLFVGVLLREGRNPILIDAQPNGTVLLFAITLSVITGLAFGLAPAFRATRVDLTPSLKERGVNPTTRLAWTGPKILVAGQIALSLILVFGAALLVRTLQNLRQLDAGFQRENVLLFALDARDTPFPSERMAGLCGDVLARMRSRSGVLAASCSTMSPVDTSLEIRRLGVPAAPPGPGARDVHANTVTPEYFRTFGIELVRGRGFTDQDTSSSPPVAVVTEAMARFYFGTLDPVGRSIGFGNVPKRLITIVGVVKDARLQLRDAPPRMVYTPLAQIAEPPQDLTVAVRATGSTTPLGAAARSDVRGLSPDVAVTYVRTMRQQIDAALVSERLLAVLSTTLGVLALLLACLGLYGVMSYDITRRTHDIGVMMALGADGLSVLAAVLGQTAAIAVAGIAAGAVAAALASRLVSGFLFGLTARDPITFVTAAALLAATALLAGYLPARRAARVDPAVALRAE